MGRKQTPWRMPSVRRARTRQVPRRLATSTTAPSLMPRLAASTGCSSQKGFGSVRLSLPTRPLRVWVCHWSRMRPVVRMSG